MLCAMVSTIGRWQPVSSDHSDESGFFAVVISNRLVTSPCAIVADAFGYTANIEKMISTSI